MINNTCKSIDNIKPSELLSLLSLHVTMGKIYSEQFMALNNTSLTMLSGGLLNVSVSDKVMVSGTLNNASVVMTDILVKGGVIHAIDQVLLPINFDAAAYCINATISN